MIKWDLNIWKVEPEIKTTLQKTTTLAINKFMTIGHHQI